MKRGAKLVRRVELLGLVRLATPLTYDARPKNREQQRRLKKALQQRRKDRE